MFTATKQGNTAVLNWKVTAERDVLSYTLERSINGISYTSIASYSSDGRPEYNKVDAQPATGLNYYRVKIVNLNGKEEYSEIRIVRFDSKGVITIFPNPATDVVNIQLPDSWQGRQVKIDLINQSGQVVISKTPSQAGQVESINVSRLSAGIYNLRLINNNGEVEGRKISVK